MNLYIPFVYRTLTGQKHFFFQFPRNFNIFDDLFKKWEKLLEIRQQVNIAIEEKRSNKIIGSSLEADVDITLPKSQFDLLKETDAKELFITSAVNQNLAKDEKNKISVAVKKAEGTKCTRCWKIVKDVKEGKCARCYSIK